MSAQVIIPNWQSPEVLRDPYPHYERLTREHPVAFDSKKGIWITSSFEDCQKILKDPRFSAERIGIFEEKYPHDQREELHPLFASARRWLIYSDGPQHDAIRTPLVRALAMQAQRSFGAIIQEEVDRYIGTLVGQGDVDLFKKLAMPFPLAIICRILGIPPSEGPKIKQWVQQLVNFIDISTDLYVARAALQSLQIFTAFIEPLLAARREAPSDDLLSLLVKTQAEHPLLRDDDIVGAVLLLFVAGHETTISVIANSITAFLKNPDQLALIQSHPELLPAAVEEVLRLDSPVQRVGRFVKEDILWDGKYPFKAGQYISILIGAANRDPREFEEPQRFIVQRKNNRHLAFAIGSHYCLGAQLARMEAIALLKRLFETYPNMSLLETGDQYLPNMTLRCRASVKVRLNPLQA